MQHRKFFVIQSTLTHMLGHKLVFALLLLMMALVFFVQLIFSGVLFSYYQIRYAHTEWDQRFYFASNLALESGEVEAVLKALLPDHDHILDVYICGLIPEEYYIKPSAMNGVSPSLSVVAFYPNIAPERLNEDSETVFFKENDVIYMDGLLSGIAISPEIESATLSEERSDDFDFETTFPDGWTEHVDPLYRINGKLWKSRGFIAFKHPAYADSDAFIISSYDQFFELADHCSSINIQFDQPLSEDALARLNQRMNSFGVSSVFFLPGHINQESEQMTVFFSGYTAVAAVILLLAINVLSLFDYLLMMRKTEFQVFLLSGGTLKTIWKCALSEIMICIVIAVGIGYVIASFPFSKTLFAMDIQEDFARFFIGNVFAFLGIVLLGLIVRMKILRLEKNFLFSERGSK